MSQRLRVGVVGAGAFAEAGHLPGLAAHPRVELVAICSRRPARGRALAERFGVAEVVGDWASLCARPDLDAVTLCTAPDEHHRAALAALASGKHVLCEKPLATSVAEAEEMAAAAARSGRVHAVAFTYRYLHGVQELRRRLRAGEIGEPLLLRAQHDSWNTLHPEASVTWRETRAGSGGGVLGDTGTHLFDLGRFLLGELAAVRGFTLRAPRRRRDAWTGEMAAVVTEDVAGAEMRFRSGASGVWQASRVAPSRAGNHVQVLGSEGVLEASLSRGRHDALRRARPSPQGWSESWEVLPLPAAAAPDLRAGGAHAVTRMMASFVDACLAGRPGPEDATFADGLAVERALAAVEASADSGWVDVGPRPA
jgi:predicted dehydrogenase